MLSRDIYYPEVEAAGAGTAWEEEAEVDLGTVIIVIILRLLPH